MISFHGNVGHLAQGFRAQSFSAVVGADPHSCTSVLAFDYRGFGRSTGFPTEEGLIKDGLAIVRYAIDHLGFSAERIVLLGHSLGTAVVAAVAER